MSFIRIDPDELDIVEIELDYSNKDSLVEQLKEYVDTCDCDVDNTYDWIDGVSGEYFLLEDEEIQNMCEEWIRKTITYPVHVVISDNNDWELTGYIFDEDELRANCSGVKKLSSFLEDNSIETTEDYSENDFKIFEGDGFQLLVQPSDYEGSDLKEVIGLYTTKDKLYKMIEDLEIV